MIFVFAKDFAQFKEYFKDQGARTSDQRFEYIHNIDVLAGMARPKVIKLPGHGLHEYAKSIEHMLLGRDAQVMNLEGWSAE